VPSPLSEFYADIQDPSISSDSRIIVLAIKNYSVTGCYQNNIIR